MHDIETPIMTLTPLLRMISMLVITTMSANRATPYTYGEVVDAPYRNLSTLTIRAHITPQSPENPTAPISSTVPREPFSLFTERYHHRLRGTHPIPLRLVSSSHPNPHSIAEETFADTRQNLNTNRPPFKIITHSGSGHAAHTPC